MSDDDPIPLARRHHWPLPVRCGSDEAHGNHCAREGQKVIAAVFWGSFIVLCCCVIAVVWGIGRLVERIRDL